MQRTVTMMSLTVLGLVMAGGVHAQALNPSAYTETEYTTTMPEADMHTAEGTTLDSHVNDAVQTVPATTDMTPEDQEQTIMTGPAPTVPEAEEKWQDSATVEQEMKTYFDGAIGKREGKGLGGPAEEAKYGTVQTEQGPTPVIIRPAADPAAR